MMGEIRLFKNTIFKWTFIVALIAYGISVVFLGINLQFAYGLALGTCISIVSFNILIFTSWKALRGRKPALVSLSLILNLSIYGYGFYVALKISKMAALACLIGFLTQKVAILYLFGIKTKFTKNRQVPSQVLEQYVEDDVRAMNKKKW